MDRINASGVSNSFPINQAIRAYAQSPRVNRPGGSPFVQSVQPMRSVTPSAPIQSTTRVEPTRQPGATDPIAKIAPKKSALDSSSIDQLIGAKVSPIDLKSDVVTITGPKPITTSAGTYNMYPHPADRIQAATNLAVNGAANVALGRSLDLKG